MFQVFHIGGLLQFEYTSGTDTEVRWSISRLSLSALADNDNSRWEVELHSNGQRAVVAWKTFLVHYRPAGGEADSVGAFVTIQLNAIEQELRSRSKSSIRGSLFARKKNRFLTSETLWSPNGGFRQWILPSIVVEAGEHQHGADLLESLLLGVEVDRNLVRADSVAATQGKQATPLELPDQASDIDEDLAPLADSFRDALNRNLDQAIANSKSLLSLSDQTNSPSNIESVVNSTLHGAVTMAILELGARIFDDQQIDVQAHVGINPPQAGLAGEQFTGFWSVSVPIWSMSLRTDIPIVCHVGLQPGQRSDKSRVTTLMHLVRSLLHDWVERRSEPLATGGDGWVCLLPHAPWNEKVFAIWLGIATPKQKLSRVLDVLKQPDSSTDPNRAERSAARQRLMQDVQNDSATFDLTTWQTLVSAFGEWSDQQREHLLGQLRSCLCRTLEEPHCGSVEADNWVTLWIQASDPRSGSSELQDDVFDAVRRRCTTNGGDDWSALFVKLWQQQGQHAALTPTVAKTLLAARTPGREWITLLAESLPETDPRRIGAEVLSVCLAESKVTDPELCCVSLLTLSQDKADTSLWPLDTKARDMVARVVDAWAALLDRSQDVAGWQTFVAHRDRLQQLGLYVD